MTNNEAMLAALREAIIHAESGNYGDCYYFVQRYGYGLLALLEEHVVRAKGEESAAPEIFPGTLAELAAFAVLVDNRVPWNLCVDPLWEWYTYDAR